MTTENKSDRSPEIAWTVSKVIFNLGRFLVGGLCALLFFGALLNLDNRYPGVLFLSLWHAFIFAILAFFIWPQRYGPPTKLIEHYQNRHTNNSN